MSNQSLLPLVARLKACPSPEHSFTQKLLVETWGCLRRTDLEHGDELTPSIMAGLVLYDEERFASLLNEAEHAQLTALAKLACERYEQQTNPPNKLGRLLAGIIKK